MARVVRFGLFEFDAASGDLRREGAPVHIQGKPLKLLEFLLAHPQELVTRAALQKALWPEDTYLEFDDGLNTAVRKLREALGDDAGRPRYLETVPRRGYRWIAALTEIASAAAAAPGGAVVAAAPRRLRRWPWAAAGVAAYGAVWWLTPLPPPVIVSQTQLTTSARIDTPVRPVSDGARVFYIEREGDHWDLMQTAVAGGEPQRLAAPGPSALVLDASRRADQLLVGSFVARDGPEVLWTLPIQGGDPLRVAQDVTGGAAYSPDGSEIVYARGNELWTMGPAGEHPQRLLTLPGAVGWLAWSHGGHRLRFTLGMGPGTSIWEINAAGRKLHRIEGGSGFAACCGTWTADGRYFLFTATRNGETNLWALREGGAPFPWGWRRSPRGPFQLTHGPDAPNNGTPAPAGNQIFFYNGVFRSEPERVNPENGSFAPDPDARAAMATPSPDGKWIAYPEPGGGLMRSRSDGSELLELAGPEYNPVFPRWSPDGKWIAFAGQIEIQPGMVYLVASGGGDVRPLLEDGSSLRDVDWSADGRTLVTSRGTDPQDDNQRALVLVDFATRRVQAIPGSEGLDAARWSYDGRYISATAADQSVLKLWDVKSRRWRVVARGAALGIGEWSPDSRFLYFQDLLGRGQELFRYAVATQQVQRVADFTPALHDGVYRCAFFGIDAHGAPVMRFDRGGLDLFAATVRWP